MNTAPGRLLAFVTVLVLVRNEMIHFYTKYSQKILRLRQTERQKERQAERQKDIEKERKTEGERQKDRHREREREKGRE